MREDNGKIEGDQVVSDEWLVRGMIVGTATVVSGAELVLHGMVTKDVVIEDGGSATINGTVSGDVVNAGTCVVFGRIVGRLHTVEGALSDVDAKAVIQGGRTP